MKTRLIFVVAGLMGMAVGPGCSEKQKEAARLEAAMKRGDTIALLASPNSTDTTPLIDSIQPIPVSDTMPLAPEEKIDEQLDARVDLETTTARKIPEYPRITDSARRVIDSPKTAIEPVLDAGAIPDEERLRQSRTSAASDKSARLGMTGYVIQTCSTPDQREANGLAAKYVRNGYQAFVTEAFIDGTTYFRVRIGRYNTIAEAEATLSEMNQKFGVNGFVAQVK